LALAAALAAPTAFADEPVAAQAAAAPSANDEVHLRSGGVLRGHVTEISPGDHVSVTVGAETKRVAWGDVERVVVTQPPPEAPPGASAARVRVHISSPKNVILFRRASGSTAWVQACTSPCNAELPLGDTYRITGNGVPASAPFTLEGPPGGLVDITVAPASNAGMIGGGFLAATGATVGFVGLVLTLAGQVQLSVRNSETHTIPPDQARSERNAGLVTMLVGAAVTAGGLLLCVSNGKTDVTQSASSAAPPPEPRPVDAFLRQPTWVASRPETAAATFPAVFQGTF
jgi:hypothetical protein